MNKPKSLRARLTLTTAMAGAMAGAILAAYGGRDANAGVCNPDSPSAVFECSGPADPVTDQTEILENAGPVTVTTATGFGIDTSVSGGNALTIKSEGGLTFDDTNTDGSIITGGDDGINAENKVGGALTITANGPVTGGTQGTGISAINHDGTSSLTISAMGVSGGANGISATNQGAGLLSITADGTVTAGSGDGIDAVSQNLNAPGIMISAAEVDGAQYGITASANAGDITIMASDTVRGRDASGIGVFLPVRESIGDITVSAAAVHGGRFGIFALSRAAGSISVTASGAVTGRQEDGIKINAGSRDATQVTVETQAVFGELRGIDARNNGTGHLTVTAEGTVTGRQLDGIDARITNADSSGDLTVSAAAVHGGNSGIVATNEGAGSLMITASGAVTGTSGYGIKASNYAGGAVSITAEQTVTGGGDGISAENDADGTSLTIMAAAAVSGDDHGIKTKNEGSGNLTITADGAVAGGTGEGIEAQNYNGGALSITAEGTVSSSSGDGIFAVNQAAAGATSLTISAAGVSGALFGVYARSEGSGDLRVTTDGVVTGGSGRGIDASNFNGGALIVTANDTVMSSDSDGISASNGGTDTTSLTISAAGVSGGAHGILARSRGTGDLTITADGTVTSGDAEGIDARISNAAGGGDIIVTTNDVNGGAAGISARHNGTGSIEITANGTVFGGLSDTSSGSGIIAQIENDTSTGDITITADTVTSEQSGILVRNEGAGSVTITADGAVTTTRAGNNNGISVENFIDGDVTISAASVDGAKAGILASNRGDGSVYVSASGTVTGRAGDGIIAAVAFGSTGPNVSVAASDVRGGENGILAQNTGTGFLSITAGNVTGDLFEGISASLTNGTDATISVDDVSAGRTGISARNRGDGSLSITAGNVTAGLRGSGDGINASLDTDGDTLTISAASVSGANNGINAVSEGSGALSITTSGLVSGASANGIFAKIDNPASTANLTVSTAGVTGARNGILADHQGLGDIIISASGLVEGTTNDGITIVNTAAGGAVTIEADAVVGGRSGILAEHQGTGALSITADGDVTGTLSDGIRADAESLDATRVTVAAQSVFGGQRGIDARNNGTGHLEVVAEGTVTGVLNEGIRARITNADSSGDLTVSAADVFGGDNGILATNEGAGGLSITASGAVTGTSGAGIAAANSAGDALSIMAEQTVTGGGDGINAENGADGTTLTITAVAVSGDEDGIEAKNEGTGDLSITTSGPVSGGSEEGIDARNYNGGNLTIDAMDTVTSDDADGIYAKNGENTDSLTISAMGVSGGNSGILATNNGTGALSITASGAVTGDALYGIKAEASPASGNLTISAAGVSGGFTGIDVDNFGNGTVSISADGPVSGQTGYGISTYANYNGTGMTIAAADVSGGQGGINAWNNGIGEMSIVTMGTVLGTNADSAGIEVYNSSNGDNLTISTAGVGGGTDGMYVRNYGSGALSIAASGTVTGTLGDGIFATHGTYGTGFELSVADVSGGVDGIDVHSQGTGPLVIEAASVMGGERGIAARSEGTGGLAVTTTGPVSGGTGDGMELRNLTGGDLSIVASQTVASAESTGIQAFNEIGTGALTISVVGVSGGDGGIGTTNNGSGDLVLMAEGRVTGGMGTAIIADNINGGALSITTMAEVTSDRFSGIVAFNAFRGTNLTISATDISGADGGIDASNFGSGNLAITTTGSVTGGAGYGISAENANGGAIDIDAVGPVTGGTYGIVAVNLAGSTALAVDAGDVQGGIDAVRVDNRGTGDMRVTVGGTVSGGTGAGINNIDTDAQGGTIEVLETASLSSAAGVAVRDGDGGTLLQSRGALAGDVLMGGGADRVQLIDGSATRPIELGAGDDAVEIFGAGVGGGWDDADFSGRFDNNLGEVLRIDGGEGFDTVELFGVTATHTALGTPVDIDALALRTGTLLQANDGVLTPFGALFIDATSTLQAEGNSPSEVAVGPFGNEGTVDLADGEANDTLIVEGDYAGAAGSQMWLDLDADIGASDMVFILGDVADVSAGPFTVMNEQTALTVTAMGRGERTAGDGIQLINVSGAADEDDFFLSGPVEAGIFDYELVFEDGGFFLQSDFFEQIYAYENLPGAMQTIGLALTGQLVERVGVRSGAASTLAGADGNPVTGGQPVDTALWARAVGLSVESDGDIDSTTGGGFEQTVGFVQGGGEVVVSQGASGRLLIGALGHWGTSSQDLTDIDGADAGSTNFDFYGGGLTATWYGTGGLYVDGVVQYTAYDIDINPVSRFSSVSTDGYGIAASGEVGYRLPIGGTAALVPQAQLTYQYLDFDDFTDPDGVRVSLDDGDSLVGRLGVAFENNAAIGSALVTGYVEANVLHEFLGDNSVTAIAEGERFALNQDLGGTSVELGFGGTVAVSRGVSLYAEVDYALPLDGGVRGVQALGGIRVNLNPAPPPPPPAPVIAPVPDTAFIVFFDWDRADLTSEANLVLDDVVVVANQSGYASIRLDGYTDLSGSAAYNLGLSERRANSVANGLIARGIAPDEIVIRAFGEENPLVPTPDGVREPQNRRVEIFLS